jgi:hypothetical protein
MVPLISHRARDFTAKLIAIAMLIVWGVLYTPMRVGALPNATSFSVNSNADATDWNPGDGKCETANGNGVCTLRAAVVELNALSGGTVTFGLGGSITYLLTLGELNITKNMDIIGNGSANTIIDGDVNSRVFDISSPGLVVNITDVTIQNGRTNQGAGIYNAGNLSLTDSRVISNTANIGMDPKEGGGIYNSGALTVTGTMLSNNSAPAVSFTGGGGGLYNGGGTVLLIKSTLSGNGTNNTGGAIQVDGGTVSIINSTVNSNTAVNGGGIFNGGFSGSGILNVTNSTLHSNTATENAFNGGGGGINNYWGAATLMNSTIYANYANRNGGGLYDGSSGTSILYNVTIAENRADNDHDSNGVGGGVAVSGTVSLRNTILANNREWGVVCNPFCFGTFLYGDCAGTLSSQDYNLIREPTSNCTIVGSTGNNITHVDPLMLGYLKSDGGPTLTAPLAPTSPAVNAGNTGGCRDGVGALILTDQRGFVRPFPTGGRCDIGAYEFGWSLFLPLIAKP